MSKHLSLLLALTFGASLLPPAPPADAAVSREMREAGTTRQVNDVWRLLRRAERMMHGIDSSWLERSPRRALPGSLRFRLEEQRDRLERLQDELARTDGLALRVPGAPRRLTELAAMRRDARALVEKLEKLTAASERALRLELRFESELQELRMRLAHAEWRARRQAGASDGQTSTRRGFHRLRRELDRLDRIGDGGRRVASFAELRSLGGLLAALERHEPSGAAAAGERPPAAWRPVAGAVAVPPAWVPGTGSITGTVTEDGSGTVLEGIYLELFGDEGEWIAATFTSAAGAYDFAGLGTGDYYVKTWHTGSAYINEVWPDIYCPAFCDPLGGGAVAVTDGAVTSGIDFALAVGGLIAGRVTDSSTGGGIEMGLEIYDSTGEWAGFGQADAAGDYTSATGLPAGDYFVWAKTIGGAHVSEVYNNVVCHFWTRCGKADILAATPVPVAAGATTSGIDLALDPAGVLTGTLTDDDTGAPISGAGVDIWDAAGDNVAWSWGSDGAGEYMAEWPLPAGSYHLTTWNGSGYLDELYDGFDCFRGDCTPTDGTEVVMTAGAGTQADFALVKGAGFSGAVVDDASGAPIADGLVSVYDAGGAWLGDAGLEGDGTYFFGGLPAGTYYAHSVNWSNYLDELYDGFACWAGCDPLDGTGIVLTAGSETTGVDFSLVLGASFSGTMRDAVSSAGITEGLVSIFEPGGAWVTDAYPDGDGQYSSGGLPPGTYHARSVNWAGYLDELYDDRPCWDGCDPTSGDPIVVAAGADLPGIDFDLDRGGSISGLVTDADSGLPITAGGMTLYNDLGWWVDWVALAGDGTYLFAGLGPGDYHVVTDTTAGYLDELYDDLPCPSGGCNPTIGTPIPVTAGTLTADIDFVLELGGTIEGVVRDAGDGSPIVSGQIYVFDQRGREVLRVPLDGAGAYSAGGLVDGSYYVASDSWDGHVDQAYAGVPCVLDWPGDCLEAALPITLSPGTSTVSGIDFALDRGGTVSGVVTEEGSGAALEGITVLVQDSTGKPVSYNWSYTDASGQFSVQGLPSGLYYAMAYVWEGPHLGELWDDLPAPHGLFEGDLELGTPIAVTAPLETPGTDFSLAVGGTISGRVSEAGTGAPIAWTRLHVYDTGGDYRAYAYSDADGLYTSPGLPDGTYFVQARMYGGAYAWQLYDGLPCDPWCIEEVGTPIVVTAGLDTGGVDFALHALGLGGSGSVSGRVVDDATGGPLDNVDVEIYDVDGNPVTYGPTDANGDYVAPGLATGTYYALAWGAEGHLHELYDNFPCWDGCDVTTGTPIAVVDGVDTPGTDFALVLGGTVTGTITDPAGAPLAGTYVDFFDATGQWLGYDRADDLGSYEMDGVPAGIYRAATAFDPWPQMSYLDELWNDRPCWLGACDVAGGDDIVVTLGNVTAGIDFVLAPAGGIAGRIVDADSGSPLMWVDVRVYDASGNYLTDSSTDATGHYYVGGLPTGSYFAATVNGGTHLDELFDDLPCPHGVCAVTGGTPISVTAPATTGGRDFALERGGAILGVVSEEGSGLPALGASVRVYDGAGQQVGPTVWTDAHGRYAVRRLPTGTYYGVAFSPRHLPEGYGGLPCAAGCDVTTTTPISVTAGLPTAGVDFALTLGASVSGAVLDAVTGAPVTSGRVELHTALGTWLTSAWLDPAGRYYASGLVPATACARTDNFEEYLDKRYDDFSCVGSCDPEKATPFVLALGTRTTGINFALYRPGTDPDLVLRSETIDAGVAVSACARLTAGPDLAVTTTDPVLLIAVEIVLVNEFSIGPGVDLTLDSDATLICP